MTRPLIKFAGGKTKIFKHYVSYFPCRIEKYIEPFCGSCSILIQLCNDGIIRRGDEILISDINIELINFYNNVKYNSEELIHSIEHMWNNDYNEVREQYNKETGGITQSARLYFLIKKCFNGLYRVNKQGKFNTPKGKLSSGKEHVFVSDDVRELSNFFNTYSVSISCKDYREIDYNGYFTYFDPPYEKVKSTSFVSYHKDPFDDKEFYNFVKNMKSPFLCSYSYSDDIERRIGNDFMYRIIDVNRAINRDKKGRRGKEMFFWNYVLGEKIRLFY